MRGETNKGWMKETDKRDKLLEFVEEVVECGQGGFLEAKKGKNIRLGRRWAVKLGVERESGAIWDDNGGAWRGEPFCGLN